MSDPQHTIDFLDDQLRHDDERYAALQERHTALLAALDALVVFLDDIVQEDGLNDHVWLGVNATKHLAELGKHREPR
jgi:hypothetical protein